MDTGLNRQIVSVFVCISLLFTATIGFAEEPVQFADSNLKEAVEEELGKKDPTPTDMLALEWLPEFYYMFGYGGLYDIKNLTGLEHARNLERLGLESCQIDEFSVFLKMKKLQSLMLASCGISDVSSLADAIQDMEELEVLSLKENQISDISPLADLRNLKKLHLHDNPLNEEAYKVYIPKIRKNNPGIEISMGFRPGQLVAPAVFFILFLIGAVYAVCRNWNAKGWVFELLTGIVSAVAGCFLGLGAQILYVFMDSFIEFFGNGYENPMWVGGVIGGVFGLLAGVWFAQHLRGRLNEGQTKGKIVGKGVLAGIALGVICSTVVHILLMTAYRNPHPAPIFIGAGFGLVAGIATGLVISVVFILSNKWGLIKIEGKI